MRWDVPVFGQTRTIRKFAWWPVRAGYQVRWLEVVCIKQRYNHGWHNEYFVPA